VFLDGSGSLLEVHARGIASLRIRVFGEGELLHGEWGHVLVRVEAVVTHRSQVVDRLDLEQRILVEVEVLVNWLLLLLLRRLEELLLLGLGRALLLLLLLLREASGLLSVVVLALRLLLVPIVLQLVGHRRQVDTFWQHGNGINELALLFLIVVEGAGLSEFTLLILEPVLAGFSLIVRVNGSHCVHSE